MSERERFEKWVKDTFPENNMAQTFMKGGIFFDVWQAALSTRKAYGYGIVDKDGAVAKGICKDKCDDAETLRAALDNHTLYSRLAPFRVVELFYEDSES